jgi:hypothetical protein
VRVLIVDTMYPEFLRSHYGSRPELAYEPYAVQWRALMDTFFGTADAYSHFLGSLGHEAHEVVINCEPLQLAWAAEHGLRRGRLERLRRLRWGGSLLLEQVRAFEPDVVYVQDLRALPPRVLRALRRLTRLLVGQSASELPSEESLGLFQLVLTSFPHYVERLRRGGIDVEYLRIGFDPRVLERVQTTGARSGVVFIGSLRRGRHGANELLARAAERAPIEFYGYGVEDWPEDSVVRKRHRGEVWGIDMYRVLAETKIALNRHIDVADDYANNMRLYEATGMGALLITDAKRNLGELFELEREVVPYSGEEDVVGAIARYLGDDDARGTIARAGQRRTLRDHSYDVRMRELADILIHRLAG